MLSHLKRPTISYKVWCSRWHTDGFQSLDSHKFLSSSDQNDRHYFISEVPTLDIQQSLALFHTFPENCQIVFEIVPCLSTWIDCAGKNKNMNHPISHLLHRSNGYISVAQFITQCKEYRVSSATTEAVSWQRLVWNKRGWKKENCFRVFQEKSEEIIR